MLTRTLIVLMTVIRWSAAEDVLRETREGKVRGKKYVVMNVPIEVYKGIPYGESPIGDLRFKLPVIRKPWEGVYDAPPQGTACHQTAHPVFPTEDADMREDCLHINLWTPVLEPTKKVPVLVWIHGGAFAFGSASHNSSDAIYLTALTGCVVAAMNYRLNILGFLSANSPDAPGNMGLYDQRLALEWVQRNIDKFGGDPSMVTIIGVSSGSLSVHAHILSRMSQGLFKRAVMISGAMYTPDFADTIPESMRKGSKVAKVVGCAEDGKDLMTHPEEVIRCLRMKPASELVYVASEILTPKLYPFFPTFHDQFLPRHPSVTIDRGFFNNVDVLTGITSDEGSSVILFPAVPDLLIENLDKFNRCSLEQSLDNIITKRCKHQITEMLEHYKSEAPPANLPALRRAYIDYLSDMQFNCLAQFFAEKHSVRGNAVYHFVFGHKSSKSRIPDWLGVPHAGNVGYLFGKPLARKENYGPEDETITRQLARMLASFAECGVPELPNGTTWPKYSKDAPASIYMANGNFTHTNGFRISHCEAWRKYL